VGAVVTSEVVVLLAVVTSSPGSSAGNSACDTSLVRVCTSEARAGAVQLTLAETSSIVAVTSGVIVVAVARSARDVVVVAVTLGVADDTETTSSTSTNILGDTLEGVVALFTTSESSTLLLELIHSHGRESCSAVVGGLVVVNLVDGNGGVDDVGLNSLLLNNRLDGLVDVVVNVLASNGGSSALAVCGGIYATLVLEASLFIDEVPLRGVVIAVVELAVLDSTELSSVLLRQDLTVLNRLNSAVVVVLVDLFVDGSLNLFVHMGLDNLVLNGRGNSLMDGGVVVSRLGHEVSDSCLGFVHCD